MSTRQHWNEYFAVVLPPTSVDQVFSGVPRKGQTNRVPTMAGACLFGLASVPRWIYECGRCLKSADENQALLVGGVLHWEYFKTINLYIFYLKLIKKFLNPDPPVWLPPWSQLPSWKISWDSSRIRSTWSGHCLWTIYTYYIVERIYCCKILALCEAYAMFLEP